MPVRTCGGWPGPSHVRDRPRAPNVHWLVPRGVALLQVGYIAMGIVAGQGVQYVSADEIPAEVFEREKQIEMGREDLKVRRRGADGRWLVATGSVGWGLALGLVT